MSFPSTLRKKQVPSQEQQMNSQPQTKQFPSTLRPKQKTETGTEQFIENVKEVPTQLAKGFLTGSASFGGNILDILGLQSKKTLPAEEEKRGREFGTLEKMQKGEVPSLAEIEDLSDDDILPRYSRLPTTPEAKEFLEALGFPEAKRAGGRYAERAGQFLGPPLPGGLKAPIGSAIAGQTAEELGAPVWAQAAAEIGTGLRLSKAKTPISSGSPKIKQELDKLKDMGFSDQDLTLARNALEDRGFLKKSSKYTQKAENKFKETTKNLNKNLENIIEESFPGITEGGPQTFKNSAVELFDSLDDFAREVTIKKPKIFTEAADKAIQEMERTLAVSPQKKEAIEMLSKAKERANERTRSFEIVDHKLNDGGLLDVTDKKGNIIGSASYSTPTKDDVIIDMLQISPKHEGKGYSTVLISELLKKFKDKNAYVSGFSDKGRSFSKKLTESKTGLYSGYTKKVSHYENLRKFSPEEISNFEKNSEKFIDRLTPANAPGDFYTNFYKEMNAIGNWGNPKQREAAFGAVKDAIKETFRKQGSEGNKLANSLEEANKAWMKYLNAEDVSGLIGKVSNEDGISFKKLSSLLQKSDNMDILKKGLGDKQAENVRRLSEISSSIGDLEKSIKGGLAKDLLGQGTIYGIVKAVLSGDLTTLKTMAGVQIAGTLSTKLLTDPSYQNIALKMGEAAKDQKWNAVRSLSNALEAKTFKDSALKNKVNSENNPKTKYHKKS